MALAAAADLRRLGGICAQDYDNRVRAVKSIRADTTRSVADLGKAHRKMSSNIQKMMRSLDANRQKMALEQHQKLTQFHNNLHASVKSAVRDMETAHSNRASEIKDHIHDMGVSRHNMGVEQQRRLTDEHLRLEATVGQMRGQLADDVDKAHQAWSDFTRKMKARRSGKPKSRPISTHAPITATAKDLSTIPGIGPGRQQKLREMGINTVVQLANANPEKIRAALGPSGHLANVEEWIEEAARKA